MFNITKNIKQLKVDFVKEDENKNKKKTTSRGNVSSFLFFCLGSKNLKSIYEKYTYTHTHTSSQYGHIKKTFVYVYSNQIHHPQLTPFPHIHI